MLRRATIGTQQANRHIRRTKLFQDRSLHALETTPVLQFFSIWLVHLSNKIKIKFKLGNTIKRFLQKNVCFSQSSI